MTGNARISVSTRHSRLFTTLLFSALMACLAASSISLPGLGGRGSDSVPDAAGALLSGSTRAQGAATSATIVHEWGTFTSIAGRDGVAMDWLPLSGSTDLPSFVEHLQTANFKGGLRGTVRMETPVLYFYSPQETSVSVHVSFSKGLITEWYPHAGVPPLDPRRDFTLSQKSTGGAITWSSVQIKPSGAADFPADTSATHYYAARETSAAPLAVGSGPATQYEKFLFYRGVSAVLPPLSAAVSSDGTVMLENHARPVIPNAVLFERRGNKIGYRMLGGITDPASFAQPALEGSLDALFSDLEGMLIAQGLFADEAHAMLETWKSSWFDEGSRILYMVPRPFVDSVLPIAITPTPARLVRVFLGRMELITPATEQAVESAFARNDRATLVKYGRFLDPILRAMIASATDPAARGRLDSYLSAAYADYYAHDSNSPSGGASVK